MRKGIPGVPCILIPFTPLRGENDLNLADPKFLETSEYKEIMHLIDGCKEYNEGVRCQEEADALEIEYGFCEETEQAWWEFWK